MNSNPMLLYSKNQQAVREFNKKAVAPAVLNNKIEALKVLANSILNEISSLAETREIVPHREVDLAVEVQRFEESLIRSALTRSGGQQRKAAKLLGVKPNTLHAKMKRYGMLEGNGLGQLVDSDHMEKA